MWIFLFFYLLPEYFFFLLFPRIPSYTKEPGVQGDTALPNKQTTKDQCTPSSALSLSFSASPWSHPSPWPRNSSYRPQDLRDGRLRQSQTLTWNPSPPYYYCSGQSPVKTPSTCFLCCSPWILASKLDPQFCHVLLVVVVLTGNNPPTYLGRCLGR